MVFVLFHLAEYSLGPSMLLQMTRFFFLWPSNIPLYMYHFFIYLSDNRHLGCFHILAVVYNAAVNIGVHMSFQISVLDFFG